MTELEKMKLAKKYIDDLANGIDPLTGNMAADSDVINNIHISRCLFYVSGVLGSVIDNGGEVSAPKTSGRKQLFSLSREALTGFEISNEPIRLSEFTNRLNEVADQKGMAHLGAGFVDKWLIQAGFLEERLNDKGENVKRPTPTGEEIGISVVSAQGMYGEYQYLSYDRNAQEFLLDNLEAIAAMKNAGKNTLENAGQPWTYEQEKQLAEMFSQNLPIGKIAASLGRSRYSIEVRLEKLGLKEGTSAGQIRRVP